MKILVVGATGGLGRDVLASLLESGHNATALVRHPPNVALPAKVEMVEGDVLDPSSLSTAVKGQESVICALGTPSPRRPSTLLREGTKNLVDAMDRQGVRRLVCVTLLGLGISRKNASFFYGGVVLRALGPMVADKEAQELMVRDSALDWTLVRPPRFVGGRARGGLRVLAEGESGRLGHVVRADLASFLVDCATGSRYVGQAVAVGS
jgi:uncharacterized protein YbjT (DUF2867 family)